MSAVLAGDNANLPLNRFTAHLALAAGVTVSIHAPTLVDLQHVVARLQPTEAANEAPGKPNPPASAATAPAGSPATQTAAPSAPPAAASAAGEQGNAAAASPSPASAAASNVSSSAPSESPAVSFDEVKKAFLGLSSSKGRAACEKVLALFGLAKLSDAKPEQHANVLAEIKKAAA